MQVLRRHEMVQQAPVSNRGVDTTGMVNEEGIEMTGCEYYPDTKWCNKRQCPTVV